MQVEFFLITFVVFSLCIIFVSCLMTGKITPWSKDPIVFKENPFIFSLFILMQSLAVAAASIGFWMAFT